MKRLIITLEYPPKVGGIASYVYNMCGHLPAADTVVYAPHQLHDAAFDKEQNWKVYRSNPFFLFVWPQWLRMLWHVYRIVRKEKIQEIHVHHALPAGYVAYLIHKFAKIPYVVFFHGTDVSLATKNNWKIKNTKKICEGAKQIIVNSTFLKEKLESKIDTLKKPITILYPSPADTFLRGVDLDRVHKLKASLALEGKKVIITVARMVEGKGYPHLARVLHEVFKQVPNVVWLIVGVGPKEAEVNEYIKKYNLQSVVRFVGAVPFELLPLYYHAADLFVLLSHSDGATEEGWGTVFLEAAASGLPVVAGRAGGVSEAVEHTTTGIVVDIHQEKLVVDSIVQLLKNKEFALQLGQNGRQRVLFEFTWEKQLRKISNLPNV